MLGSGIARYVINNSMLYVFGMFVLREMHGTFHPIDELVDELCFVLLIIDD